MCDVTAGQIEFLDSDAPVAVSVAGVVALVDESPVDSELGELDLLADALSEALAAKRRGLVIGGVGELALARPERRARRADARSLLRTQVVAA